MSASAALLTRLIDYAGLFPPAALDMETAVRHYQSCLAGDTAWLLRNFVVPARRLSEFVSAFERICGGRQENPWTLSVVCADKLADDSRIIEKFPEGAVSLASLETKATNARTAEAALAALPSDRICYVEFPPDRAGEVLPVLMTRQARAKLRTGGLMPQSIPSVESVAHFLLACAQARIPFKATAGMHFPLRGEHPLDSDSSARVTHGFLNVFLAAALAWYGAQQRAIVATLSEQNPAAFQLDDDLLSWHGNTLTADQLEYVRRNFAISFGSCSFTQPVKGLRQMGWI